MNETFARLAFVVILSSASACAAQSGYPAGRREFVEQRVDGPYVLAGSEFDVELEQPIDRESMRPGDAFAARVRTPLKAPNGNVVVPTGVLLTGKIVEPIGAGGNALALKFESIETIHGPAELHASVQSVGKYASVAPLPPVALVPESEQPDALLRSRATAIGGGPPEPGMPVVIPPVRVPQGAVVHMALLSPLVPPGVAVERPPRRRPRPAYNEPPYRSNIVVPSNPLDFINP